jgi:hypothetical protein
VQKAFLDAHSRDKEGPVRLKRVYETLSPVSVLCKIYVNAAPVYVNAAPVYVNDAPVFESTTPVSRHQYIVFV